MLRFWCERAPFAQHDRQRCCFPRGVAYDTSPNFRISVLRTPELPRRVARAAEFKPDVVFYPNNRVTLPAFEVFGARAKVIGAPMLVTNRVGRSWAHDCHGRCVVYSPRGQVLVKANGEGREEILLRTLKLPKRRDL